jgi:hypothetical protein
MRAHHEVHLLRRDAGGREVVEITARAHVPERRALAALVVADTRVDHDGVLGRLHEIGLDARRQVAHRFIEEVRLEP